MKNRAGERPLKWEARIAEQIHQTAWMVGTAADDLAASNEKTQVAAMLTCADVCRANVMFDLMVTSF